MITESKSPDEITSQTGINEWAHVQTTILKRSQWFPAEVVSLYYCDFGKKREPWKGTILTDWGGSRLGNNWIGIQNAMHHALITQTQLIFPVIPLLKWNRMVICNRVKVTTNWYGTFFYGSSLESECRRFLSSQLLTPYMHIPMHVAIPDSSTLVIHVRGGDMMVLQGGGITDDDNASGVFVQPNETFYDNVIAALLPPHIIVVTDSEEPVNPCVHYLKSKYHATIQSSDIVTDFVTLMLAERVVLSNSTFAGSALFLSPVVKEAHMATFTLRNIPNVKILGDLKEINQTMHSCAVTTA